MNRPSNLVPDLFHEGNIDLSDLSLHFVEGGAGQSVVLLHGYTDTWYAYRLLLPLLAPHFRCLALDQRGHGASAYSGDDFSIDAFAGDVIELLPRLGVEKVSLIGHSMGSFVARKVALRRPDLVHRLVLVSSGPRSDDLPIITGLTAELEQFPTDVSSEFVEEFVAGVVPLGIVPDLFYDQWVEAGSRIPAKVWRGALAGLGSENHSDQLGEIGQPTLVIGGQSDGLFPPEDQEQLARALAHGRLELYEGAGHYPHWERPARFVEDVARFLGEPE